MSGRGAAELARVLRKEMRRHARRAPTKDLGTIMADMALKLDSYKVPIEADGYLVEETFAGARTEDEGGGAGDALFADHSHEIRAALAPGDRVVVDIIDADDDGWTALVSGRIANA